MRLSGRQLLDLQGRIAAINRALYELEDCLTAYANGEADDDGPIGIPHTLDPPGDPAELERAFRSVAARAAGADDEPLLVIGQGDAAREYSAKDLKEIF
jgi:hypothetical protein